MRDHEDGHGLRFVRAQRLEQVEHFSSAGDVEVARWLVGEEQTTLARDGTRDGHALLLTARELLRHELHSVAEADTLQRLNGPLLRFLGGHAGHFEGEGDVVDGRQAVDEVEVWKIQPT